MEALNKILEFELISVGEYKIRVYSLVIILLIFMTTKAILWLIKRALYRRQKSKKLDTGNAYALFQIIKYIIWVIAIGFILETIGINSYRINCRFSSPACWSGIRITANF